MSGGEMVPSEFFRVKPTSSARWLSSLSIAHPTGLMITSQGGFTLGQLLGMLMKRHADITQLLEECDDYILKIERKYDAARSDEQQLEILKPLVKSTMEHFRGVLDYSAQDIWESYTVKNKSPYFPYGKDEESFLKSLNENLPGLKIQRPDLLAIVESIQPHRCGETWLSDLCSYANFNKHNRLKPQIRKNSPSSTLDVGGGLIVMSEGGSVKIGRMVVDGELINKEPLDMSGAMPVKELREMISEHISIVKEYDWVEFHFDGSIHDVQKLLVSCQAGIGRYIEKLNAVI